MSLINDMYGIHGGNDGAELGLLIGCVLAFGGLVQIAELPRTWRDNRKTQAAMWLMGLLVGIAGGVAASYFTWNPLFDSLHRYGMDPDNFGMSESAANWYAGGISFGVVAVMTGSAWNLGGYMGWTLGDKLNKMIEVCQRIKFINGEEDTGQERSPLNRPTRGNSIVPV